MKYVETWWTTTHEALSAGWHPYRWHFGMSLDIGHQDFKLLIGPLTLIVSWWSWR